MVEEINEKYPSDYELVKNATKQNMQDNIYGNEEHASISEELKINNDLTRWQQDLAPELELMVHDLRGECYNEEHNQWMKHPLIEKPLCNEKLIFKMVAMMRPLTSKNLIMSNYTESRILNRLYFTTCTFVMHLAQNRDIYEIQKGDLSYIVRLFKDTIEATFFRAYMNGERQYLRMFSKRIETHSEQQPDKKKWFGGR